MEKPLRVLHILTEMKGGGVDGFLMNMYRHMDHSQVQFDFLLGSRENIYAQELEEAGSRVHYISRYTRHPFRTAREIRAFLRENPYSVVHVHGNALMHTAPLREARRAGVPLRIMHSHSTSLKYKPLKLLHAWNRLRLHRWCNCRMACSEDAGRWMFREPFQVIRNAIDPERFRFDPEARDQVRREWGAGPDTLVLGHVGRFLPVKNHSFLLSVLGSAAARRKDVLLVLVGSGPLMEQVRSEARQLGLEDRVRMPGIRSDVPRLLSGMDAFLLPSRYEGLGIAAIEAQANGLPTLCSDAVPREALVTDHARQLPARDPEVWARELPEIRQTAKTDLTPLIRAGYDIQTEARRLQELYPKLLLERTTSCHE